MSSGTHIISVTDKIEFDSMVSKWYDDNKSYFNMKMCMSGRDIPPYIDEKERDIINSAIIRYIFLQNEFTRMSDLNVSTNVLVDYMSYMTYLYTTIPIDKIDDITNYITLAEYIIFDKKDSSMLIPLMYLISYSNFRVSDKDCSILRKLIEDGMDKQSLNVYVNTLKLIKDLYFMIMPRSVFKGYETFTSSYVWFMNETHKLNKERSIANRKLSVSESDIIKDIVSIIKIRNVVL